MALQTVLQVKGLKEEQENLAIYLADSLIVPDALLAEILPKFNLTVNLPPAVKVDIKAGLVHLMSKF